MLVLIVVKIKARESSEIARLVCSSSRAIIYLDILLTFISYSPGMGAWAQSYWLVLRLSTPANEDTIIFWPEIRTPFNCRDLIVCTPARYRADLCAFLSNEIAAIAKGCQQLCTVHVNSAIGSTLNQQ